MRQLFIVFFILQMGFVAVSKLIAQQQKKVNFTDASVFIKINPYTETVKGQVIYSFNVLQDVDSVFLDARQMKFLEVKLNNSEIPFSNNGKKISVHKVFKKGETHTLSLSYKVVPKKAMYFIDWKNKETTNGQVWTQGQGKYTSHWLPSFDDMNEKVEFDLSIQFDADYKVIANGKLKDTKTQGNLKSWFFDMEAPMSSYLVAFVIGNYKKKEQLSKNGTPLAMYYYPKDSLKVEPTYRYSKRIFDFLESEIGVPYPWQEYNQIPVKDFMYAGMENTGTTIFSDSFIIDSIAFVDKNYINVNAHELAHQWFGNLVTQYSGEHHWLHEGFATYYALLTEKEIFGEDYFNWKMYDTAEQLHGLSKASKGEALTDPKASSLTFYDKGAWALYILQEKLGERSFKKGIGNYLKKHQFKNVTIANFIQEMEKESNVDLSDFKTMWLTNTYFPFGIAINTLEEHSIPIKDFNALQNELKISSEPDEFVIRKYWNKNDSSYFRSHLVTAYYNALSKDFLKAIFKTKDLKVRQALLLATEEIPNYLKDEFESLLVDDSYITLENALYKLWVSFPENKKQYLDKVEGVIGFSNKNVRLLWLTLAFLTKGYSAETKQNYFLELSHYTDSRYNFNVRQGAFMYLKKVVWLTDKNLRDLVNASTHHIWQFKKYARKLLDKIVQDKTYKGKLNKLLTKDLSKEEFLYLKSILRKK